MTTAVKTDSSETTAVAIPRHRRTRERHEARTGWIFMLPFVLGFTLVFLLPIGASVYSSFFQEVSDGGGLYGGSELVKEFVGLENYYNTVANDRFWLGILRVILYTLIQVPVMIFVGLALALVLDSMLVRHVEFTGSATSFRSPFPVSWQRLSGSTSTLRKFRLLYPYSIGSD